LRCSRKQSCSKNEHVPAYQPLLSIRLLYLVRGRTRQRQYKTDLMKAEFVLTARCPLLALSRHRLTYLLVTQSGHALSLNGAEVNRYNALSEPRGWQ